MKKTSALFALFTLLVFLVPASVVHATPPANVYLFVTCDTGGASVATLGFAGHTVSVSCSASSNSADLSLYVTHASKFTATLTAGGFTLKDKGTYGPGRGAFGNAQMPPNGEGELAWCISPPVPIEGCNEF